ncbi:anthranilate synthase component I family protein [Nesterenkonia sandarakina]|uniref:Anthranilate synthase component 1/para-aminobenzoate synthetase n=1 Tax=Nesterenkonia sandarakina TaxID=272918 RepID=A0A2T0YQC6_9MICC|nr:anthranilate synthase component I family protein [Nesterenkonia sandarakina]PRZ17611.1 anthranilate synthase component 1/para-aminobenzoate synthetase [Nesterenkonia sandarakina]
MRTASTGRLLALDELFADHLRSPGEQRRDTEDLAAQLFTVLGDQLAGVPAALLESSDHARTDQPARSAQSILAFSFGVQAATVTHLKGWTSVTTPAGTTERRLPFFSWLAENWTRPADQNSGEHGTEQPPRDTPRFALGWVGWLGYELKREAGAADPDGAADLADTPAKPSGLPAQEAGLFRATHAVVIHHHTGELELQCLDPAAEADWEQQVICALGRVVPEGTPERQPGAAGATGTAGGAATDTPAPRDASVLRDVVLRDARSAYLAAIEEAKREITAGNSYEICLTTAVTGTLAPGHARGVELFAVLRARNRAPFTAYLSIGETEILSTSPERFLSVSAGGTVRSEPIKGTRPRGATAAADRALIEDLRTHPKDRAENVMIADLTRNDLSIHAVPGSLRTERLCAVETYPSVHQLVSTVSARIPDEVPRARVVADAFPPGSMTGAPKISTMDILERLETGARGPYSGVAGYFSLNGAADLAVLIRTAVLSGGSDARRFHLGLGGAITADSDPAEEWEEIRTKSRGVLEALGAQFPDAADDASR